MKKFTLKACSAILSAILLTPTPALLTANAEENSVCNENMASNRDSSVISEIIESDGTVLFSGATGDEGGDFDSSVRIIETIDEYYEFSGNKSGVNKSGAKLTEVSTTLPESVDNSQSKYFPAIGHQGTIGSCVSWAQTYYQFTYEMNRDMDVETTPENTFKEMWCRQVARFFRGTFL